MTSDIAIRPYDGDDDPIDSRKDEGFLIGDNDPIESVEALEALPERMKAMNRAEFNVFLRNFWEQPKSIEEVRACMRGLRAILNDEGTMSSSEVFFLVDYPFWITLEQYLEEGDGNGNHIYDAFNGLFHVDKGRTPKDLFYMDDGQVKTKYEHLIPDRLKDLFNENQSITQFLADTSRDSNGMIRGLEGDDGDLDGARAGFARDVDATF